MCCPSPSRAQSTFLHLSQLVTLLSSGSCHPSVVPHLCGATLLASDKKSGGLRPIAIGKVLQHLTSKCLSAHVLPLVKQMLSPHQVGVGTKKGAEALVHSLKLLISNSSIASQSMCCLLLTPLTAQCFFKKSAQRFLLSPPGWNAVMGPSPTSWSSAGKPPGPLALSLVLHPLIERIQRDIPGLLFNGWFWMMALYAAPLRISLLL